MNSKFLDLFKTLKKQLYFHLLINLLIGVFITFPFYIHVPLNGIKGFVVYALHFLAIQFTLFGFTYFLSINKYIFYAFFPFLFIVLSIFGFWVYVQDISISSILIEAIFETSLLVSLDLITFPLIIMAIIILVIIYFIVKKFNKLPKGQLISPLTIFALAGILMFFIVENSRAHTFKSRSAYVVYFSFIDFLEKENINLLPVKTDVKALSKNINIVFVLGESVRADHIQLNGYQRETTPKLSKIDNVISFPNIFTPLTHTVASVQTILTSRTINSIENNNLYSIYSIINQGGFSTQWIGNSTVVKSYAPIIYSNKSVHLIDKFRSIMSFQKALDEKMLKPFDSIFGKQNKQFITLHMTGSHWWYENRYTNEFRKYSPIIDSKYIPSLTKEQIVNSYDNTILYLDNFLSQVISSIEKSSTKTILIYLSDHGEILGENGKWLHAQENDSSKNPAMMIWYSNEFRNEYPSIVDNLQNNSKKFITIDYFYHSILDLIEIQNFEYSKNKSIFNEHMNFKLDSIKFNKK